MMDRFRGGLLRSLPGTGKRGRLYGLLAALRTGEIHIIRRLRRASARRAQQRDYQRWIARMESGLESAQETPKRITFLVIQALPTGAADDVHQAIRALQAQTWGTWCLWLILPQRTRERIVGKIDLDARVRISSFETTLKDEAFWANSTDAYRVFLHDRSRLAPHALQAFARYLEAHPQTNWLYSDEDRLDPHGQRHYPWFKPDWSPELLYSAPYLHPLLAARQRVSQLPVESILNRTGINWATLYDLCLERADAVGHVPEILCHQTDNGEPAADRLRLDAMHAEWVASQLRRRGCSNVQVTRDPPLRTTWKTAFPLVSIIIPTRGDGPLLKRGLQSLIRRTAYARFEVIIVQSGEGAKVLDRLEGIAASAPGLRVLESPDPFNYSQVNNRAADQANGEVLLFLNDDVEIIDEDWLEELARWVMLPEIGVVGAKLLYPNRMIQHLGVVVGLGGHAGHLFLGAEEGDEGPFGSTEWYRDVTAVTGACLMIERDTFQAVGGFDEAYELAFGDIDLCLRVREHGLRVMVTPFARLIHHEGATRGRYTPYPDMQHGAEALMALIHRGDPHFNPNLSYASTYPRIVQEPEDRVARLRSILDRAAPREERAA